MTLSDRAIAPQPNSTAPADLIVEASVIHVMDAGRSRARAVRDGWIVATSEHPDGLDALAGPGTRRLADPAMTLLPAFSDTHERLLESSRNLRLVPADRARSIDELIGLIRLEAGQTPPGRWIVTAMGWDEGRLRERRLPTAAELDRASDAHPVLCPRGGHICAANSLALRLAGITWATPDPPGGAIARDPDGVPTGVLEGSAAQAIKQLVPPPPADELVARLADACDAYAALGIGCVREALLEPGQIEVYRQARAQDLLTVRCRPLLNVDPRRPLAERLAYVEAARAERDDGDDWLRVWGLKLVVDGGVAGASMHEPYADDPSFRGHLNWDPDELAQVVGRAVELGWRVAAHAAGDRAVTTVLDAYEQVLGAHPGLPRGTLAIEHAMLAGPAERARAVRLGIAITVQHQLLYRYGEEIVRRWGAERAATVMPVRSWLEAGAEVSAGSDAASPVKPLLGVWGMATRATRDAGVQGAGEAIGRSEALELYTSAGPRLTGEASRRGTLEPGRLADFVAYTQDPATAPLDQLPELVPVLTVVGGHATWNPEGRLP